MMGWGQTDNKELDYIRFMIQSRSRITADEFFKPNPKRARMKKKQKWGIESLS